MSFGIFLIHSTLKLPPFRTKDLFVFCWGYTSSLRYKNILPNSCSLGTTIWLQPLFHSWILYLGPGSWPCWCYVSCLHRCHFRIFNCWSTWTCWKRLKRLKGELSGALSERTDVSEWYNSNLSSNKSLNFWKLSSKRVQLNKYEKRCL